VADNVTVSNAPTSVNADIPVRSIDKSGEQIQVVAIDYGGAGAENLTVPDFATETTLQEIKASNNDISTYTGDIYTALSTGQVSVKSSGSDILGVAVSGTRNNQIEISFFSTFDTAVITNTTTSTGSATIANGHALYATGTGTSATAKGVSVQTLAYRPAHEEYAYFSAAFTAPTSSNSDQRIGLYDANNGYFIGYKGTTFGVTQRTAAVDTFTARTSWNGDLLTGAIGSAFTRAGIPEAINLAYSNLFRIRFAWLGSASVIFDVFSPDGAWVTFHTFRIPNSQLNPHVATPNLPMTVEALKASADATNLTVYTACWAGGTTSEYSKITDSLTDNTLAGLTRSVITGRTTAGGSGYVNVKVNPSGALTTATSIEDISAVDGQKTMALSFPVVIASDQSILTANVDGSFVGINDITNIVGQQNLANSIPVAIASNQILPTYGAGAQVTAGKLTVAVAGTATRITTSTTVIYRLDLRAALTNNGTIYVGGIGVSAATGFFLSPGETYHLEINNLAAVYFDASVSGDAVHYVYTQ